VRKIAARFGGDPGTVQRISRLFEAVSVVARAGPLPVAVEAEGLPLGRSPERLKMKNPGCAGMNAKPKRIGEN
jgi:hypothetical protein